MQDIFSRIRSGFFPKTRPASKARTIRRRGNGGGDDGVEWIEGDVQVRGWQVLSVTSAFTRTHTLLRSTDPPAIFLK